MFSDLFYGLMLRFEGIVAALGLLMLAIGLALFDGRVALIITGGLLLLLAVWPPGGKK